jgi:uncharacterized membrane protein
MLKNLAVLTLVVFVSTSTSLAQFCSGTGNVIVYSNYDGGVLNISVDQNIPNLKIGICSYEAVTINISGPFAGNVTGVHYAGFDSYNTHCDLDIAATTISGVSTSITEILFAPTATVTDPVGYGSIICGYGCDPDWQGGCNTAVQIAQYFVDYFNGELRSYFTQYGCWLASSYAISAGGTCCPGTEMTAPVAEFNSSDDVICPGDCIDFTDTSTNTPDEWDWTFSGASVVSSSIQNPSSICYNAPGNYAVTLTATNIYGSTVAINYITVEECPVPGCTYPNALNYNPIANVDDQSCQFDCDPTTCEGDFNEDGVISVTDLIHFIGLYGNICPN